MRRCLFYGVLLLFGLFGVAGRYAAGEEKASVPSLTLSDCLQMTLSYSRDMLSAREGIRQSEGLYIQERSAALPRLSAHSGLLRARDPSMALVPGLEAETDIYQAGVTLKQAVFTWGQVSAALDAAALDREASEQRFRQARAWALRETAIRFYDVLLSRELEKVASGTVAQKRRHLEETIRRNELGVATDYDVLAARVALANAGAEQTRAENAVRLALDRLRYMIGKSGDFDVSGDLSSKVEPPMPLESLVERALAARPEMAYADTQIHVFEKLKKVASAGDKPRIDLEANLLWQSYGNARFDDPGESWNAGLYLSFPFFDGMKTRGSLIQADSRIAAMRIEKERLIDAIYLEARDAVNRIAEAIDILSAMQAAVEQAEKLLEMAEAGYRAGVKTRLEVEDAQLNLTSARTSLARAKRESIVARIQMLWIAGEDLLTALQTGG
uniref:TolC family protein n=1 Tax=Desulfatirhabdium butyrativorans TaxID=340467 RepID=A0A7C4ML65_9BACT